MRNGAFHELPCAVADEAARLLPRDRREREGGKRLVDVILDVTQRIQKGAVEIQKNCFEHRFLLIVTAAETLRGGCSLQLTAFSFVSSKENA